MATQFVPLQTAVVLEHLGSNLYKASPLASPSHAAVGTRDEALLEVEVFLESLLEDAPAQQFLRFEWTESATLESFLFKVRQQRKKSKSEITLRIEVVRLPASDGEWGVVLGFWRTFFVPQGKDFLEFAKETTTRAVAAEELDDESIRSHLQSRETELVCLQIKVPHQNALTARGSHLKTVALEAKKRAARLVLSEVAIPFKVQEKRNQDHRASEIEKVLALLCGSGGRSVRVVGARGAGTTTVLREALRRCHRPIYSTSSARLVSGAGGFGGWQERLEKVIQAAETLNIILHFEDLADLFLPEQAASVQVASMLREAMKRERMTLIGEVTDEEEARILRNRTLLVSYFSSVAVVPFSVEQTIEVLAEQGSAFGLHEKKLVELVVKQLAGQQGSRAFPGRAFDFVQEVALLHEHKTLSKEMLINALAAKSGVPAFLIDDDVVLKRQDVLRAFESRVAGQSEALSLIADALCRLKAHLGHEEKPLSSFLFCGPTGVGKTEVAKALAHYLFGSTSALVRFDMSEYADPFAADRLIRGTASEDGLLTKAIRRRPFAVLLLDEIEKADAGVFDLLLQVLGEGRLSDARGRVVSFRNTIVVMTSNLGTTSNERSIGFSSAGATLHQQYLKAAKETFRPEFLGRLDALIPFASLTASEAHFVTRLLVTQVSCRSGLVDRGIGLEVDDDVIDVLMKSGLSQRDGARALRRVIEDSLVTSLTTLLVARENFSARSLRIRLESKADRSGIDVEPFTKIAGEEVFLHAQRGQKTADRSNSNELDALAKIRRGMARDLERSPVTDVRQELESLTSDLSAFKADFHVENRSAAQARLQRLSDWLEPVEHIYDEICELEDLAIVSFAGENLSPLLKDKSSHAHRFRHKMIPLLAPDLASERHGFFRVQNLDSGLPSRDWLQDISDFSQKNGIVVDVFVAGQKEDPENWDIDRPYGRAKPLLEWLQMEGELKYSALLMQVQGELGPLFFALECGLHKVTSDDGDVFFHVVSLSAKKELSKKDWTNSKLAPLTSSTILSLKKNPVSHRHAANSVFILKEAKTYSWTTSAEKQYARREAAYASLGHFESENDHPFARATPIDDDGVDDEKRGLV